MHTADVVPTKADEARTRNTETATTVTGRRDVTDGYGRALVPSIVGLSRAAGREDPR